MDAIAFSRGAVFVLHVYRLFFGFGLLGAVCANASTSLDGALRGIDLSVVFFNDALVV